MFGDNVCKLYAAARRGSSNHVGASLYHIGDDSVRTAVQTVNALYLYNVRARAAYLRAAGIEKVRKVNYVRLSCRVFDNSNAVRKDCGEHDVYGSADGHNVKEDACADGTVLGVYLYAARAVARDRAAETFKALDVLVYGSAAEIAAAGIRHFRVTETTELGAEQIIRAAYLAGKIGACGALANIGAVYFNGVSAESFDVGAHVAEDIKGKGNVADIGHVFYDALVLNHDAGINYGHGGVFHTAYLHAAAQWRTSVYNYFIHMIIVPFMRTNP